MPRTLSAPLQAHFQTGATTIARLTLLVRADGTRYGFTSTDIPVTFAGDTYEPIDGGAITSINQTASQGIDNAEFQGILSSSRILDSDIVAGKFDGASLTFMLVNYLDLTMGAVIIGQGFLGEIKMWNSQFQAEFRSFSQLLRQQIGEVTTATCRVVKLGDSRCRVNLAGNTVDGYAIQQTKSVTTVTDFMNLQFASVSTPTGYYNLGILSFLTGSNAGVSREIKNHTNSAGTALISLRQPFPYPVLTGDSAVLQIGCDRLRPTCSARFNNVVNFRGEPDLPGNTQFVQVGRPPSN